MRFSQGFPDSESPTQTDSIPMSKIDILAKIISSLEASLMDMKELDAKTDLIVGPSSELMETELEDFRVWKREAEAEQFLRG